MKAIICPCSGMNVTRLLLATVVSFIFVYAYDYLVHVILLMDMYEATEDIWRSEEAMREVFHWIPITQFLHTLFVVVIFAMFLPEGDVKKGTLYGVLIGIVMGIGMFSMYSYSPIPMALALAWLAAGIGKGVGIGVISSKLYKKA